MVNKLQLIVKEWKEDLKTGAVIFGTVSLQQCYSLKILNHGKSRI